MAFERATKRKAKLRIAISGTAGAGKTYSALTLAQVFGTRIGVIDSERGSASLYAEQFEFGVEELDEKNPQDYLRAIAEAEAAGIEVLIIDSYSHAWVAALDLVDRGGGWVKAGKTISPLVAKLVDAILSYPGHVIVTMRSKAEHAVEIVDGRAKIKKLGTATVAREGTDYEFSVMLEIASDGELKVTKTRCSAIDNGVYRREDITKIGQKLKAWLESGVEATPREKLTEAIRRAGSLDALAALVPQLKALGPEDLAALRSIYAQRKAALAESADAIDLAGE